MPASRSPSSTCLQRLGVGGMQAGRRLVEDVDHAEEPGPQLGRQPQPLQLAGRQGGHRPVQGEVAQPEVDDQLAAAEQVGEQGAGRAVRLVLGAASRSSVTRRSRGSAGEVGDVVPGERDGQGLRPQPSTAADRAGRGVEEAAQPAADRGRLAWSRRSQDVVADARPLALVRPLDPARLALEVHGDHRLLVGEQDPVPVGLVRSRHGRSMS